MEKITKLEDEVEEAAMKFASDIDLFSERGHNTE